jgi:hypothetical protein
MGFLSTIINSAGLLFLTHAFVSYPPSPSPTNH